MFNVPVIVEDLREHAWMSVEEVLVQYRIVVGQRFGQPAKPRGRYFLQSGLVCLVPDAADVQHHPVLGVYVQYVHHSARAAGASRRLRLVTTYHVNLNRRKPHPPLVYRLRPCSDRNANLNMASARLQINPDGPRPSIVSPTI